MSLANPMSAAGMDPAVKHACIWWLCLLELPVASKKDYQVPAQAPW